MTKPLKSTGLAALAFALSLGIIGATVAPAIASAAQVDNRDFSVTAPDDGEALVRHVAIGDLDLAQARDMRRLDARIRSASRLVCAPLSIGRMSQAEEHCRYKARHSTDRQVAKLRTRAIQLAAAGAPTRIDTILSVVATDAE